MTAVQIESLNSEIQQNIKALSEDENMLNRLAKYLRRLMKEKDDPTLMSKEEFFRKIDLSLEEAKNGDTHRIESKKQLVQFLNDL